MGLFNIGCKVENHKDGGSAIVPKLMVDTGSEYTWIDARVLEKLGIERRKKDIQIRMANRRIITRSVGYAILRVNQAETTDEVVFAEPGDLLLLGCRALEGLNLRVDSRAKKLVAAGPVIAAPTIKSSSNEPQTGFNTLPSSGCRRAPDCR
jgi:predicted aspartyl protease